MFFLHIFLPPELDPSCHSVHQVVERLVLYRHMGEELLLYGLKLFLDDELSPSEIVRHFDGVVWSITHLRRFVSGL